MKEFRTALFFIGLSMLSIQASSQLPLKNYETGWKKVNDLVLKELPQSAFAEVKKIYELAKKDRQDAQLIKSLLYMINLQQETRENNELLGISDLEKETAGFARQPGKQPVVSILNSLLAEMYWMYYQQNRWTLYNSTQTKDFVKEDIATWSPEDFYKKVSALYLASLSSEKILQQTKLEPYDAIITKGNVRHLRPTLFDLLAYRALDYFKNDERDLHKPAYAFEIDQASAFDPATDFAKRKYVTKDSLSLYYKALTLYQQLITFHLNDSKPDALIDADLQRIAFVLSKSVHPDKDQLYRDAITHIANQYGSIPAAAQAWYLLAAYYNNKGQQYKPYGDSIHRLDRVRAKEICEKVLAQKDSSEGRVNCYNLLQQINSKTLQFSVEKVNVPAQSFRALITYRNFTTLYLRLLKADEKLKKDMENQYEDKYWASVLAAAPLKSWQQSLPGTNDLQQHEVEIKIDGLPEGEYVLVASTDKEYNKSLSILGARLLYVSNISFVNYDQDFFILNRQTGQPLAGASVQVWEQVYNYKTGRYTREKGKSYTADANGFFRPDKKADKNIYNYSYLLDITYNKDRLFMNDYITTYYYPNPVADNPPATTSVFFFTDRGIYRPGQTLYFKGIVLSQNRENKKATIQANYETMVYLQDGNGRNVDSLKVKSNEFGSFSARFQLPQSGLNGLFILHAKKEEGSTAFRVEEYKRPKFYVDYEPLKNTYKVNDKIKITGTAKAYAGNNIDGATVRYRVVRRARFLYPWVYWRGWLPPAEPMEITNGTTATNADGKFTVEFTAIPDRQIDKKTEPVFDYTVYADVTDINGETRSGEQNVSVSYKSLLLKVNLPAKLPVDSLQAISIRAENMNGEFQPAVVKVALIQLKEENRLIRPRYWNRPDQFVMTRQEYIRNFPFDEYDNETAYTEWERLGKIVEKTDSVKENSTFDLKNVNLNPGVFLVEVTTKDKNGEEVKDIHYIELYDEKSNRLSQPQYLWTDKSNPVEPGETTSVKLGTSADNLFVVQQRDNQTATGNTKPATSYSYIKLNNEKKEIVFSATEADRGGYGVNWVFVKNNRVYQYNETISVPWSNKDLTIEYATFRDKTLPGSEEKWKLKITGYRNEKAAAEILASMYDASLDQFYPYTWNKPSIYPSYYTSQQWNGAQNFSKLDAIQKPGYYQQYKSLDKRYDYLAAYFINDQFRISPGVGYQTRIRGINNAAPVTEQKMMLANNLTLDSQAEYMPQFKKDAAETVKTPPSGDVQIRKNFNETAFFFPDLRTDSAGAIEFSFTLPEALTRWKFQALAHTKELAIGYSTRDIVTQKQLMVQPNAPRFLREGDKIEFSSKIVNLTGDELKGQAVLQLMDAATNQPVDGWFKNNLPTQSFTVAAGQSSAVEFPIEIPTQFNKALVWRIVASAGDFSDGEENAMPVLTNRMLVTETMTLPMKGTGTKDFSLDKLLQSGNSKSLQQYALTVEYTSNPAWYAVQALPYLMEYPYECAEQNWNRYYANSLATYIANSSPRIRAVFEKWSQISPAALMSNLQKNEELKSVVLEETPWVLQAKTEAEQKKNIALLFDMIRMTRELNSSYEKLKQLQSSNGGFVWFKGGPDDRYMTQYIITGMGHLKKLNGIAPGQDGQLKNILSIALPYLDKKIKEDYDNLVKSKTDLKKYTPGSIEIQYLYMRSFFPDYKISAATQAAYNYFRSRLPQGWTNQNKYMQGMIALTLFRTGDKQTPQAILKSLKETAIINEELGMYWKDTQRSWWWYESPIERQTLLIEAFQEISNDKKTSDDLRTWLLKNKQTNNWESTKATAEACYALLLQGTQWLDNEPSVTVKLGGTVIQSSNEEQQAGTGYFKTTIEGEKVKPEMGNISVTVASSQSPGQTALASTWGGVYWQYFEDLDKITPSATPLSLVKKLFVETNGDRGPVLTPVKDGDKLKIGDKIKVRIELRVDREMEYVHMKDMRASCLEPVNVLSSYKWQNGLGYYESTRDASTSFFFSNLRKGAYVFEYPLFVTHSGNFSNGVTTIQCMYAPEFSAHSEGIRIDVK